MEVECCSCRRKFKAHRLINGKAGCPHCGEEYLVMLHVCPGCFDVLREKDPKPQPYKCPVCNGRGSSNGEQCFPCNGTGIIWFER